MKKFENDQQNIVDMWHQPWDQTNGFYQNMLWLRHDDHDVIWKEFCKNFARTTGEKYFQNYNPLYL